MKAIFKILIFLQVHLTGWWIMWVGQQNKVWWIAALGFVLTVVGIVCETFYATRQYKKLTERFEKLERDIRMKSDMQSEWAIETLGTEIDLLKRLKKTNEQVKRLNKAVFFDTCHEVLPDIEAENENKQ